MCQQSTISQFSMTQQNGNSNPFYLFVYRTNTYIDSIKKFADALQYDLLDVLVEVAVQDGVGAGGRQANQVTDHVGSHQAF